MFRRAAAAAVLALSLIACSEQSGIAAYFEDAQSIAERMAETSGKFETLINAQENPLEWSDASKAELHATLESMRGLRADAAGMRVPEAFKDTHPLLVQSLDNMVEAIGIIDEIAADPSQGTMERAEEMTAKATEGERLANQYVAQLEAILREKYPEMVADAG